MLQRDVLRLTEVSCPSALPEVAERVTNSCNQGATDLVHANQLKAAWRVLTIALESSTHASRASELRCLTYSNMAYVLYKQNRHNKALAYAQKAHTMANMSQDDRAVGAALLNVALCTAVLGEWEAGAHLCTKAIYRLRGCDEGKAASVLAMHNLAVCEIHQLQDGDKFDPAAPVETLREAAALAADHLPEGHVWRRAIEQANQVAIGLNLSVSLQHNKPALRKTKPPGGTFGIAPHRSHAKSARSQKPRRVQTAPRVRPVHALALPCVADQIQYLVQSQSSSRTRRKSVVTPTTARTAEDLHALLLASTKSGSRSLSRSVGELPLTKLEEMDSGLQALVQQRSKVIRSKSQSGQRSAEKA